MIFKISPAIYIFPHSKTSHSAALSGKYLPSFNLPTAHLAIHDGRCVEMCQQVIHHVVILLVPLHHTVIGWNKGPQSVLHQPEVALLLSLTKPLQQCAVIPNMKTPCEKHLLVIMDSFLKKEQNERPDKQTCMSDHLQPLLRFLGSHRKER